MSIESIPRHSLMQTHLESDLLVRAIVERSRPLFDSAIKNGLCREWCDERGRTAIFYTIQRGYLSAFLELIKHKADQNHQDHEGLCPLTYAITLGKKEFYPYFTCDIEQRDKAGQTPLYYAIAMDDPAAFKYLINQGANWTVSDYSGMTPLMYAASLNKEGMVRELVKLSRMDRISALRFAVFFGNPHMARDFFKLSERRMSILRSLR